MIVFDFRNTPGLAVASAEDALLRSPQRVANHIKAMHWLDLGFGPYLGRFFGGDLPMSQQALEAAEGGDQNLYPHDAVEAIRICKMREGMTRMLGGTKPIRFRTFHHCDPNQKLNKTANGMLDLQHGQGLNPTFVDTFADSRHIVRHRWCASC